MRNIIKTPSISTIKSVLNKINPDQISNLLKHQGDELISFINHNFNGIDKLKTKSNSNLYPKGAYRAMSEWFDSQ